MVISGCIEDNKEGLQDTKNEETIYNKIDFFRGSFYPTNLFIPTNQTEEINFQISPIGDTTNTTIQIFLPYGVELIDGELQWNGDAKKDEIIQFNVTIKPTKDIRGDVKAEVYTLENEIRIERTYYVFISTKGD